jgi:hypothetical protein
MVWAVSRRAISPSAPSQSSSISTKTEDSAFSVWQDRAARDRTKCAIRRFERRIPRHKDSEADLKRFELGRPLRAAAPSNYYGLAGGVIADGDDSAAGEAIAPVVAAFL